MVRHHGTPDGRFQGQMDVELNVKGLEQAELLAKRLAGHKFEAIITSPLARAEATAKKLLSSPIIRILLWMKGSPR